MDQVSAHSQESEVPQTPNVDDILGSVDYDWAATDPNVPHEPGHSEDAAATPPDGDEQQTEYEPDGERDRALAISRGWVDKDKWKGYGKWVDAKSFNERYEHVMPVVQKENERLRQELKQRDENYAQLRAEMDELRRDREEQRKTAATIQLQTLQAQRNAAMSDGDFERANQLADQITDLRVAEKMPAPAQQQRKAPEQAPVDPYVKETLINFVRANPTFHPQRNPRAIVLLTAEAKTLQEAAGGGLPAGELLEMAKTRVEKLYPEMFARSRGPAMAEMGGAPSRASGNKRTWSDLTPEAQKRHQTFIESTPELKGMKADEARAGILQFAPASDFRSR